MAILRAKRRLAGLPRDNYAATSTCSTVGASRDDPAMKVRQSDITSWTRCPLAWKYENLDGLRGSQGGSSVFGSLIHDCVMWMEVHQDPAGALARFAQGWRDPVAHLGFDKGQIDYYERGRNWVKFNELGPRILERWWSIIRWDSDVVLGRELWFDNVPVGKDGHVLTGTIDKLAVRYLARLNRHVVVASDYKTNAKVPTYEYLEDNIQFTAYLYATTTDEFWTHVPNGAVIKANVADMPRVGEWVHLQTPKRLECGERRQHHYRRLAIAVDALALSVQHRIFVPNISGETCRWCPFRDKCGLPEIVEGAA